MAAKISAVDEGVSNSNLIAFCCDDKPRKYDYVVDDP